MTVDRDRLRALAEAATPGPWFLNYSAVHAKTLVDEHVRVERLIEDEEKSTGGNLPDDHPLWSQLPDTAIATVEIAGGDTPTRRGARNGEFIAEVNPAAVLALLDEVDVAESSSRAARQIGLEAMDARDAARAEVDRLRVELALARTP